MPQVTSGATLLRVDVRFLRKCMNFRATRERSAQSFVELKGMSAVRPPAMRPIWKDCR